MFIVVIFRLLWPAEILVEDVGIKCLSCNGAAEVIRSSRPPSKCWDYVTTADDFIRVEKPEAIDAVLKAKPSQALLLDATAVLSVDLEMPHP